MSWPKRMLLVLAAWCIWPGGAGAQTLGLSVERCEALSQMDFTATRDAAFVTTAASVVSEGISKPQCRVSGHVEPEISFEIRMPLVGWNGGLVLVGSGGWATEKFLFLCKEPVRRGYACIAGDAGHQSGRGLWLRANPQARIDWGYRGTHVTVLAGKALVQAFYGVVTRRSVMIGASTGGYQALVSAQRFPHDFDGIIAIAPDIDEAGLAMRTIWTSRSLSGSDGKALFAAADLETLHRAVLAACDPSDGLRDGIVSDPVGCRFDPSSIVCKETGSIDCLSEAQATAAARVYAGATTSTGEPLAAGGLLPGSELGWGEVAQDSFPDEFFRYALADRPDDGRSAASFDFDQDSARLGLAGTMISSNPDLRRFHRAGGKLLIVQGAADSVEQPAVLIDYFEAVERVAGGRGATRDFARLFIVPGMNHVSGGTGAFAIDYLTAIERWLDGYPPAMLAAAHVPEWSRGLRGLTAGLIAPGPDETTTFWRPVFPYPAYARYMGKGDVADIRHFRAVEGGTRP